MDGRMSTSASIDKVDQLSTPRLYFLKLVIISIALVPDKCPCSRQTLGLQRIMTYL